MTKEELQAFLRKNLVAAVCGVICVLIGVVAYLRSDVEGDTSRILDAKQAEGERIAANISNSEKLKEQLAALTAANEAIARRTIEPDELAENQRYFYRLEADTGVKITQLVQSAPRPSQKGAPKGTYTPVNFDVSVQGDYSSILDFLRQVESGPLYCRVVECAIRPFGSGVDRGGPLSLTMTISLLGKS